jgi:hypothetical protein
VFEPGNKLAKGGKRKNAGRPPKNRAEVKKAAQVIAREFIEENVKPVLDNYLKLAKGYYETRYTQEGQAYEVFVPDGPTTRHFVDKLLPEIKSDDSTRPIAIQVVIEAPPIVAINGNGHANGHDVTASSEGNGRAILIGSE